MKYLFFLITFWISRSRLYTALRNRCRFVHVIPCVIYMFIRGFSHLPLYRLDAIPTTSFQRLISTFIKSLQDTADRSFTLFVYKYFNCKKYLIIQPIFKVKRYITCYFFHRVKEVRGVTIFGVPVKINQLCPIYIFSFLYKIKYIRSTQLFVFTHIICTYFRLNNT